MSRARQQITYWFPVLGCSGTLAFLGLYVLRFPFKMAWLAGFERPFVQVLQFTLCPVLLMLCAPFLLARGRRGPVALGLAAFAAAGGCALVWVYLFTGGTF